MTLKKLEVPTSSITEVKKSPMDVFAQAREAQTGVYIFNREKIAGVMLTQEQYETLVQELEDCRKTKVKKTSRPSSTKTAEPSVTFDESQPAGALNELTQSLQRILVTGATISAKNLDEKMVVLGFITKKTGFGGVTDMLHELTATGKINYQLRKKQEQKTIVAEIIGEQDSQSQLFDKVIVKKVYLHTR